MESTSPRFRAKSRTPIKPVTDSPKRWATNLPRRSSISNNLASSSMASAMASASPRSSSKRRDATKGGLFTGCWRTQAAVRTSKAPGALGGNGYSNFMKNRWRNDDFTIQHGQPIESANTCQIDDRRCVTDDHSEHSQLLQSRQVLLKLRHIIMRRNVSDG